MLRAISEAARILQARPEPDERDDGSLIKNIREILIVGSGISTAGLVNVAEHDSHLMYSDAHSVVERLHALGEIPDLHGIRVTWVNMDRVPSRCVCNPEIFNAENDLCGLCQMNFNRVQWRNLRLLWELIITAGGGELYTEVANPGNPIYYPDTLPFVSIAPVREDVLTIPPIPPQHIPPRPRTVPVQFIGNQPRTYPQSTPYFVNRTEAERHASAWVEFANDPTREGVFLFGTTASIHSPTAETLASGRALGLRRAEAVRTLLVNLGVPESRIIVVGLGFANPWNVANGITGASCWNGDLAELNRNVFIMSKDDPFAISIYEDRWGEWMLTHGYAWVDPFEVPCCRDVP
jgi:hypothetical protein